MRDFFSELTQIRFGKFEWDVARVRACKFRKKKFHESIQILVPVKIESAIFRLCPVILTTEPIIPYKMRGCWV
jgi:hypothetical protein